MNFTLEQAMEKFPQIKHWHEQYMKSNSTFVDLYTSEADTEELLRLGQMPKPLRLAAGLEKTMQWPLHGKAADCLREMYDLLQGCETEMRYAGWDKREADNHARNDVYEEVKSLLGKNT